MKEKLQAEYVEKMKACIENGDTHFLQSLHARHRNGTKRPRGYPVGESGG